MFCGKKLIALLALTGSLFVPAPARADWVCNAIVSRQSEVDGPKLGDEYLRTGAFAGLNGAQAFLRPLLIRFAGGSAAATTLTPDGAVTADKLTGEGANNGGIYFYEIDGTARALKVIPIPADARKAIDAVRSGKTLTLDASISLQWILRIFATELVLAGESQRLGGAKLYGGGLIYQDGKLQFFLDLEWLGAGEKTVTYKKIPRAEVSEELARNLGRMWAEAMESGIIPRDSDAMVYADQSARWMDSGGWMRFERLDELDRWDLAPFWQFHNPLWFDNAAAGDAFRSAFENRVNAGMMSAEEKNELLRKIAAARPGGGRR